MSILPCRRCGLLETYDNLLDNPLCNTSLAFAPAEIAAGQSYIASLREMTRVLEDAIELLRTRQARVEARLAQQMSYLAPVQRLPNDVLLIIMKIACEVHNLPQTASHRFHEGSQRTFEPQARAPWSIAAVTRRWRALALSIPQLWARLEYISDTQGSRASLDRVRWSLQIGRSQDRPLFVRLDTSGTQRNSDLMDSLLEEQAYRIQELDADLRGIIFEASRHLHQPLSLASLQKLRIVEPPENPVVFCDTPALGHLALQYDDLGPPTQQIISTVSWSTLISLQLDHCVLCEPRNLLQALRFAANLSVLKIVPPSLDSRATEPVPLDGSEDTTPMPRLTSFHLSFQCDDSLSRSLLMNIRAPSLAYLQVSHTDEVDIQALLLFIQSSAGGKANHPLTALSLCYPQTGQDFRDGFQQDLIALLQHLIYLQRLRFHEARSGLGFDLDLMLSTLSAGSTVATNTQICCPRLQELHISNTFIIDSDSRSPAPRSVQSFCESRRASGRYHDGSFDAVFLPGGVLSSLDGIQEDTDVMQWMAEAQQTGLLKYPAPENSWGDIFDV